MESKIPAEQMAAVPALLKDAGLNDRQADRELTFLCKNGYFTKGTVKLLNKRVNTRRHKANRHA